MATTLKQVLIAMAAAAVPVLAIPLGDDATATTGLGAPKPAVTQVSQPLEGKELEDFLSTLSHVPEGSIDISNTTLAYELAKFYMEHRNDSPSSSLAKRSGLCSQGDCPDFNAAFDLYEQHIVAPVWGTPGGPVNYWAYWGRWNDCGQCGMVQTSKDGCWDFTSCGRPQNICIDTGKSRAHRIWKDNGHKTCYSIKVDWMSGDVCPPVAAVGLAHPTGEIPCNW